MDINRIFNPQQLNKLLGITVKLFGIVLSGFYIVFSIVIIRQVQVMKRTVEVKDYGVLSFLAFIQLIAASVLFLYSLFIL